MSALGLYLHVPFCSRRCGYCAFHTTANWRADALEHITDAMLADIDGAGVLMPSVTTIYVGGGTPTVLPPDRLASLVTRARDAGARPVEITVEANPESATPQVLDALADSGVTRLSVGVQTLEPEAAAALDRRPTTIGELQAIRRRWPGSLSADLIHGAPGATERGTLDAVERLVALGVDHLSVYLLSVDEGTPLARAAALGTVKVPEPDTGWSQVVDTIERHGLHRYEVSNFALPGHECRHNEGYWHAEDYLGIGPSAVSTLGEAALEAVVRGEPADRPVGPPADRPRSFTRRAERITQPSDHARYLRRRHPLDAGRETLGRRELLVEYVMLGLRTSAGIDLAPIRALLSQPSWSAFVTGLARAEAEGLLVVGDRCVRPTGRGMDLLDRALADLVPVLLADLESAQY